MSTEPATSSAEDYAIEVKGVSKAYRIWRDPAARLKFPLLQALGGILPKALQPAALRRRIGESHNTPYYKDFFALRDINFTVRRGETFSIIGRNGSGKSTLLQIIAGTLTPTNGHVRVKGRVAALLELGSGFNPDFTGRENVYLNASILGLSREETHARFSEIAAFADIGDFIDQPVKTYSSGMTMRLAFAVITAIDPDILIIDEALAVGDIFFIQKCMDKIRALKARGCTLLFVSHSIATIIELCEKATLLRQGAMQFLGSAKETVDLYDYERVASLPSSGDISAPAPLPANHEIGQALIARCRNEIPPTPPQSSPINSTQTQFAFLRVFDTEGIERTLFPSESTIYLVMGFWCSIDLNDPATGFKLRDIRGQTIYETSSHTLGYALPADYSRRLHIGGFRLILPLIPGEYTLTAALANGRIGTADYETVLFYQHDAKRIDIHWPRSGHTPWSGICNLHATPLLPKK